MHRALQHTFQEYSSGNHEVPTPICDADKKILKHNTRKHNIYDTAFRFCDELFSISSENQEGEEGLDTLMTTEQLLSFTSGILSIVLSHHFQKEDIKKIVLGTSVDFKLVRDTMYKYSKKAEEKFFQSPCMAYFFIQFANSPQGKSYIQNKLYRSGLNQDVNESQVPAQDES